MSVVAKLPLHGFEGIADCDVGIFVLLFVVLFATYNQFLVWNVEINSYVE